jgi:hypothetical protein
MILSPSVNPANGAEPDESPLDFGFEADQVDSPLDMGFAADSAHSPLDFGFGEEAAGPVHSPLDLGFDAEPILGSDDAVVHSPLDLGFSTEQVDSPMDFGFVFGIETEPVHSHAPSVHGLPTDQQCKIVFIRLGPC